MLQAPDARRCIPYALAIQFGKPIIGLLGGIGSGKSYIAQCFAELGCAVIDSDQQVRDAYADPAVRATLRQWWGGEVLNADGTVNRRAIAQRVFNDPAERLRLEALIHPRVNAARERAMAQRAGDPAVLAYVWDTPLLIETGLDRLCDRLVFVETPLEVRLERVRRSRGWDAAELLRRENWQTPLDNKRALAHDVVVNAAGADDGVRDQVRAILSRTLAAAPRS